MKRLLLMGFIAIFLAGCASSMPAPVVNKSPQKSSPSVHSNKAKNGDWRPDSYVVKKGDTLYSIGLNHGLDYREIAAANNIYEPFTIAIGQRLSLASLKKAEAEKAATGGYENEVGVIVTPIDTGAGVSSANNTSVVTPVLTEPKAQREPYSVEALNRKTPAKQIAKNSAPSKTTQTTTPQTASSKVSPVVTSTTGWTWPTKGKVIAGFGQTKNKGIDIAGNKGQAVTASASGKVIYAGSDLRGYGKLVIIKHSKSFLSVYAHNSKIIVKEGQLVKRGQNIAAMGNTDTNRVKLHFEIRQKGKSVDPAKFLPQN